MLWSLSYHISPIYRLLPIFYNLSFHSLGWHPTSSVLTSFWLHEWIPCTWCLCPQTKSYPFKCADQATKVNSHHWAQTVQMGKIPEKDNSFQIEGQIFILPFKKYLYMFFQRKYGFEPDWYLCFYTTWLFMYSQAGFWLMPAGIFLGHGQKWHKDSTLRRQDEQHCPSLEGEGKEHFPCYFFSQGLPSPLSLLAWG